MGFGYVLLLNLKNNKKTILETGKIEMKQITINKSMTKRWHNKK